MRDYKHLQAGGLVPLLTEAIPSVSSSAQLFANTPSGSVAAEVTVSAQDLVIMWNKPGVSNAATTLAGGGQRYPAGDVYWFDHAADVLLAARGIQGAATCTGTITYYGLH